MAKIRGLDKVLRNLNREIERIQNMSVAGLKQAVMHIRRVEEPKVPVGDTGNLNASWFETYNREPNKAGVLFGHQANYASAVHEMYGANFRRPGAQAGFLLSTLKSEEGKILDIIGEDAKIRGGTS